MTHSHSQQSYTGFTLIELLCIIAIFSITFSFAFPGLRYFIEQNKSTAFANNLVSLVNTGRQTAISSGEITTFCPTEDQLVCTKDWSKGAMVFRDKNANMKVDNNDKVIRVMAPISPSRLFWRAFQNKQVIQFSPLGYTRSQNGTFTYCGNPDDLATARILIINKSGRARPGQDNDNDGIYEQPNGGLPKCS